MVRIILLALCASQAAATKMMFVNGSQMVGGADSQLLELDFDAKTSRVVLDSGLGATSTPSCAQWSCGPPKLVALYERGPTGPLLPFALIDRGSCLDLARVLSCQIASTEPDMAQ